MPADLQRAFVDYDFGLLRIIASQWAYELRATTRNEACEELIQNLINEPRLSEHVATLPELAQQAMARLTHDQQLPVAHFTRAFGELRAMGPARRDREQPWLNAPSAAETLWYRGLIARAFFDDGRGPQEFIFIPSELVARLTPAQPSVPVLPGIPAPAPDFWQTREHFCADDLTTLLAYLQIATVNWQGPPHPFPAKHRATLQRFLRVPEALELWALLAERLGLVSGTPLKPDPHQARPFLEASRSVQVQRLAEAWREALPWNDLRQLPGLIFEGKAWRNDPVIARQIILKTLGEVPAETWWSLSSLVVALKERQPDFQRPAGDYDSWYIRSAETNEYLRGFGHWEQVDGALIKWIILHPLSWLGLVELAEDSFRFTAYGAAFVKSAEWPAPSEISFTPEVTPEGVVRYAFAASRYERFQLARLTDWSEPADGLAVYRFTPASLNRAVKQGVKIGAILAFLQKLVGAETLPPTLTGALRRWERVGSEAVLRDTLILKLKTPDLLKTLQRTPALKRYLGEVLGPTAVAVRREDLPRLREVLAELGILADWVG